MKQVSSGSRLGVLETPSILVYELIPAHLHSDAPSISVLGRDPGWEFTEPEPEQIHNDLRSFISMHRITFSRSSPHLQCHSLHLSGCSWSLTWALSTSPLTSDTLSLVSSRVFCIRSFSGSFLQSCSIVFSLLSHVETGFLFLKKACVCKRKYNRVFTVFSTGTPFLMSLHHLSWHSLSSAFSFQLPCVLGSLSHCQPRWASSPLSAAPPCTPAVMSSLSASPPPLSASAGEPELRPGCPGHTIQTGTV